MVNSRTDDEQAVEQHHPEEGYAVQDAGQVGAESPFRRPWFRSFKGPDFLFLVIGAWIALRLVGGMGSSPIEGLEEGAQALPVDLPTLDAAQFTLEDHRDRPVLLLFWATWCPACGGTLSAVHGAAADGLLNDYLVLSVNMDADDFDRNSKVNGYLDRKKLNCGGAGEGDCPNLHVLMDDGNAAADYRISNLPSLVLLDREHRIARSHKGPLRRRSLLRMTREL